MADRSWQQPLNSFARNVNTSGDCMAMRTDTLPVRYLLVELVIDSCFADVFERASIYLDRCLHNFAHTTFRPGVLMQ